MSTHALGTGTQNINVNAPVDFKTLLGQLAAKHGQTMGEWLRSVIPAGVEKEDPQAAQQLRVSLKQYYGSLAFLLLSFLYLQPSAMAGDDTELRRPDRRPAIRQQVRANRK